MGIGKKIKKNIRLTPELYGPARRQELLDKINEHGTFLPKSILHEDLDRGFLDFVKNELEVVVDGKKIPTVDILITSQNWSQFVETWNFQDLDKNISLPFIATVRMPEVKYGTFQGGAANIPNRRQFFYYTVPTWDGQRKGADVYKIPQPIPVDITYNVKLFCNRMREINEFNKIVMQTFTSKQAYQQIKGHYIPIILDDVSDESAKELEKRKYYIANYKFTMKGLLIDEEEFQVSPAISRQVTMFEVDTKVRGKKVINNPPKPNFFDLDITFLSGVTQLSEVFRYTADLKVTGQENLINCYNTYLACKTDGLSVHSFYDHIRFFDTLSKYEPVRWNSKTLKEFQAEHTIWSDKVDFYTRGKYNRNYSPEFVEKISKPIELKDGTVFTPVILQKSEEYVNESIHQSNCVRTYQDRPGSLIISLRKENGDRASIEYRPMIGTININEDMTPVAFKRVQTLGRFNNTLDESWDDASVYLDVRLKTVNKKLWGNPTAEFITGAGSTEIKFVFIETGQLMWENIHNDFMTDYNLIYDF